MNIIKTAIEGVVIIEPKVFNDERGYFFESYNQKNFNSLVKEITFVQDNESCSQYGVIRGLHFQKSPYAQSKLVRVVKGRVLDVAVDIRRGSPTFGKHVKVELTENNHLQFFIPKGFAHSLFVPISGAGSFNSRLRCISVVSCISSSCLGCYFGSCRISPCLGICGTDRLFR